MEYESDEKIKTNYNKHLRGVMHFNSAPTISAFTHRHMGTPAVGDK